MLTRLRVRPLASVGLAGTRGRLARSYSSDYSEKPAEPFKILFCGSDEFSTAALAAVLEAEDTWQSIVVLTPRERRIGRGGRERYLPPLKSFALDRRLTTYDVPPTGLREGYTFPKPFTSHHPTHLLLTASFGHIIPTPLLEPFGHALNVHPSLLPKYRGAAPVQWSIANGETSTGVTVQTVGKREAGVDSGAILGAVDGVPIPPDATYPTFLPQLSHMGGRLLVAILRQLQNGSATPRAQVDAHATRAPKITTDMARVDWRLPAANIEARHRGFGHHSPLWTTLGGDAAETPTSSKSVQLLGIELPTDTPALANFQGAEPGTAVLDKRHKRVLVATRDGWIAVTRVKAAGRKEVPASEWWNGLPKGLREQGWAMFV